MRRTTQVLFLRANAQTWRAFRAISSSRNDGPELRCIA
jgi:hypothetical protein